MRQFIQAHRSSILYTALLSIGIEISLVDHSLVAKSIVEAVATFVCVLFIVSIVGDIKNNKYSFVSKPKRRNVFSYIDVAICLIGVHANILSESEHCFWVFMLVITVLKIILPYITAKIGNYFIRIGNKRSHSSLAR